MQTMLALPCPSFTYYPIASGYPVSPYTITMGSCNDQSHYNLASHYVSCNQLQFVTASPSCSDQYPRCDNPVYTDILRRVIELTNAKDDEEEYISLPVNGDCELANGLGCEGPFHEYPSQPHIKSYKWAKPISPYMILNTDGSSTEERCGMGGIIRDDNGDPLVAFALQCDKIMSIDELEILAIWRGLLLAIQYGVEYVSMRVDSSQALRFIRHPPSEYPIQGYVRGIRFLLGQFKGWNCRHVYRETNKAADVLSKLPMNGEREIILSPFEFPSYLSWIIEDDKNGKSYVREKSVVQNSDFYVK